MSESSSGQHHTESKDSTLSVNVTQNGGAAILTLSGCLVSSEITHFRRASNQAQKSGLVQFVLDLSEVESIDGYGLASLVGLLSRTRSAGGELILCGINPDLRQRFEATHCDMIFKTAFTVAKALEQITEEEKS